jgi:hypothetical protein
MLQELADELGMQVAFVEKDYQDVRKLLPRALPGFAEADLDGDVVLAGAACDAAVFDGVQLEAAPRATRRRLGHA